MKTRSERFGPAPSRGPDVPRERVIRLDLAPLSSFLSHGGAASGLRTSSGPKPTPLASSTRRLTRLHRIDRKPERFESAAGHVQERIRIRWHLSDLPGSVQLSGGGGTILSN